MRHRAFWPTEHHLDPVAAFVVSNDLTARLLTGDAGFLPPVFQNFTEPLCITIPVRDQPFSVRETARRGLNPAVVVDLSLRPEEPDRATLCIRDGVQLGFRPCVYARDQQSMLSRVLLKQPNTAFTKLSRMGGVTGSHFECFVLR